MSGSDQERSWPAPAKLNLFLHITGRRGLELGVDYALTLSCYDPAPEGEACGRCDACRLRLKGFAEAGLEIGLCSISECLWVFELVERCEPRCPLPGVGPTRAVPQAPDYPVRLELFPGNARRSQGVRKGQISLVGAPDPGFRLRPPENSVTEPPSAIFSSAPRTTR